MPRSKHRRKGKSRKNRGEQSGNQRAVKNENTSSDVYLAEHPFNDLDNADIRSLLIQSAREAEKTYPQHRARLESLIGLHDPIHMLSVLAVEVTFGSVSSSGDVKSPENSMGLLQSHVVICP